MTSNPANTSLVLLQRVALCCISLVAVANSATAQDDSVPQKNATGNPSYTTGSKATQPTKDVQEVEEFHSSTHWNVDRKTDFLKVGTFRHQGPSGGPRGWDDLSAFETNHATYRKRHLSLHSVDMVDEASISTSVDLPKDAKFVTLEVNFRGLDVQRDDQVPNAGAGVVFSMLTSDGQRRELPRIDIYYKGYRNWATHTKTVRVLPKETKLNVKIEMKGSKGKLEVGRIKAYVSSNDTEPTEQQIQKLQTAIRTDDPQAIAELVEADPRMLEARSGDCNNCTPLGQTAWHGSPKVAAKLIELGADMQVEDYVWKNTPLQWCCYFGRSDVAKVLLDSGAEIGNAVRFAHGQRKSRRSPSGTPKEFDAIIRMADQEEQKRAEAAEE